MSRATVNHRDCVLRAQGCLLGQIAGDSLGSLVEFKSAQAIRARYPDGVNELADGGTWNTLAGQPTDDSELALALARSLVRRSAFDLCDVATAYAQWYDSHPFDIGGTTRTALAPAARALRDRRDPAPAASDAANRLSQANGALMRISPLGIFGHSMRANRLAEWARADAGLTHPNPVCRDASAVFVVTIARLISHGDKPHDAYRFARAWAEENRLNADVQQTLERAGEGLPRDYSHQMGWVLIALQNAFHRLAFAQSLQQGVVDTVMHGGDTDTNAAIAGALLGAAQGIDAIPAQWRECVLSCRPERGKPGVHRPRPVEYWPIDTLELAEQLFALGRLAAVQAENNT